MNKLWIARQKSGALFLFTEKPQLSNGIFLATRVFNMVELPEDLYPEVTFENSPLPLKDL